MRCLFCGKELALLKRWTGGGEFCSDAHRQRYQEEFVKRLSEFMGAVRNPDILTDCVNISRHVMIKEYYRALMLCRRLIEYEDERLGNVAPRLSAGGAAG